MVTNNKAGTLMGHMVRDRILARKATMINGFQSHRNIITTLKMSTLEEKLGATQLTQPQILHQ